MFHDSFCLHITVVTSVNNNMQFTRKKSLATAKFFKNVYISKIMSEKHFSSKDFEYAHCTYMINNIQTAYIYMQQYGWKMFIYVFMTI